MANKKIKHFIIENQVNEITFLAEEVEKLTENWGLNQALAMNINLVIEEAVTNIIFYAFTDDKKHQIEITISVNNNRLTIKIADDGIPFDPLLHKKPDITLSAEERAVGGLGIFLISQIMDKIHYTRNKNQNILTLTKSI
jgi:serine/threonine-protein kinase RsbW